MFRCIIFRSERLKEEQICDHKKAMLVKFLAFFEHPITNDFFI